VLREVDRRRGDATVMISQPSARTRAQEVQDLARDHYLALPMTSLHGAACAA